MSRPLREYQTDSRGFGLQDTGVEQASALGFRIGSPVSCQGSGFVCVCVVFFRV